MALEWKRRGEERSTQYDNTRLERWWRERLYEHVLIIRHSHSSERVREILGSVLKSDDSLGESVVDVSV